MKHHIASPGALGTSGSEHRAFEQDAHWHDCGCGGGGQGHDHARMTDTQRQRTPLAPKSAEAALAELSVSPRGGDPRSAQIAGVVARKKPAEALLSGMGEATRSAASLAASPGAHVGDHHDAEESEATRGRRPGTHARKTKND
jgi:hypothetical protein